MSTDRRFLLTSLLFALLGMGLGEYMGASGDHSQHVTHAHILLVGFVVSFVHAVIHRLWLSDASALWGAVQHGLHTLGSVGMAIGLWLMIGGHASEAQAGPVLGLCAGLVMLAVLMALIKLMRSGGSAKA